MHQHVVPYGTLVLLLLFCSSFPSSRTLDCKPQTKTISVDKSGGGDTKSVQAAIDAVPMNNDAWIKIHVKAGTYLYMILYTITICIYTSFHFFRKKLFLTIKLEKFCAGKELRFQEARIAYFWKEKVAKTHLFLGMIIQTQIIAPHSQLELTIL